MKPRESRCYIYHEVFNERGSKENHVLYASCKEK
jgi:hypothetical protein